MAFIHVTKDDSDGDYNLENLGLAIARGQVPGATYIFKYGKTQCAVANTEQDCWDNDSTYVYFDTAKTLGVSSSSANDTSAGTGARTITITGLDSNWDEITEVITMNGQTKVTTTNSFLRVYRARITTSGTLKINDGNIFIYDNADTVTAGVNNTDSLTQAVMLAGEGTTLMALTTVPAGYTGYLVNGSASMRANGTREAELDFYVRTNNGPWIEADNVFLGSSSTCVINKPYLVPQVLPEKTDIRVSVESDSTSTEVTASFTLILISNS